MIPKLKSFYTDRDTYQSELSIIEKSMHFDIIIGLLKYITFKNIEDVYIFYNLIQLIDDFAYYKSLDNVVGLAIQELEKFDESELRAKIACDIFNAAGLAYLSFDKSKALLSFLCEEQLITKFFSSNERVKSVCYCNIGLVYTDIDFDKANHYFCKALEMEKRCFGEHSMEVADVYHNIGKNYLGVSDYPNASLYLEKALHIKRSANKYTYSLLKTEFGLANALNFMLKEPFVKEDIEKIRELYIAVLEGYKAMNNIHDHEYNNTLLIISAFLDKIGEHLQATKLKELLTCCVQSSPDNQAQ